MTACARGAPRRCHAASADTGGPALGDRFYLRRDGCGTSSDNPHLSTTTGTDGGDGCGIIIDSVVGLGGDADQSAFIDFPSTDGMPLALDTSRNVTGAIDITGTSVGLVQVDVSMEALVNGSLSSTRASSPASRSRTCRTCSTRARAAGQNSVNSGFYTGRLDGFSIVLGHEVEETITDPGAEDVINGVNLGGWYDLSGWENGDKCAWVGYAEGITTPSTVPGGLNNIVGNDGKPYPVQSLWSNDSAGGVGYCAGASDDLPVTG